MPNRIKMIIELALEIIEDNAKRREFMRELTTREILDTNDAELMAEIAKTKEMLGEKGKVDF